MNEATVCTRVTGFVTRVTRRVTHVQTVDSFVTYHWDCNKSNTTGDTYTDSRESTVCTCVTRRVTLVTNPVISHEWVQCLYMCHPSFYSCYKPSDKYGWHMYRQWTHSWLITGFVTRVTRRVTHVQTVNSFMTWVHCLYMCHPSCYSYYKPSDKSWMSPLSVHVSPVVLLLLQTQW
jgi:hypothetical protein